MAHEAQTITEARHTQALDAAARVAETSAQLEQDWSSGGGMSASEPAQGHAEPVPDLTHLDQLLTAPGYQVLRSRPKVPTSNGAWFADEPFTLNRARTRRLIEAWAGALDSLLLRDPSGRLHVVNHRLHMELVPTLLEPPHTEGDVLCAALQAYGLPAYEHGESGVTWLAVPLDPATSESNVYEGTHFRISSGEHVDRVASAHDDVWGASLYDARGEYVDTLDACPPGSTLAEDSAYCARAIAERIAAAGENSRASESRHRWESAANPTPGEGHTHSGGHVTHHAQSTIDRHTPASLVDIASWTQTLQSQRADARGVARLVADTLRVQFPQAAYLVLFIDDDRDMATDLFPDSLRDAEGQILNDFDSPKLPPLPEDSPLRPLWGTHSPTDLFQVRHILRTLRLSGAAFDDYPEDLRTEKDDEGYIPCLLLSSQARPEQWNYDDDDDDRERLLRPYSAPDPQQSGAAGDVSAPFADRCRQAAHRARVVAEIARDRWADPATMTALRITMAGHLDAAAAHFDAVPTGYDEGVPTAATEELFRAEQIAVERPAGRFPAELGEYILAPLVDRDLPFPARLDPVRPEFEDFAQRETDLVHALHVLHADDEHQRERTEDWLRQVFAVWQAHARLAGEVRVDNARPSNKQR
ncbi:hypothetical protein ACWD0J_20920 [Streptomyces sp. NPDC003011]